MVNWVHRRMKKKRRKRRREKGKRGGEREKGKDRGSKIEEGVGEKVEKLGILEVIARM